MLTDALNYNSIAFAQDDSQPACPFAVGAILESGCRVQKQFVLGSLQDQNGSCPPFINTFRSRRIVDHSDLAQSRIAFSPIVAI